MVSLPKRINAQYMLQSCNDTGCTDSNVVSFTDTLVDGIGYFKASNLNSDELFGFDVAFSADGGTIAVGAPSESGGSGAVYLFSNSGGWAEDKIITASNGQSNDYFGYRVALSSDGSTLAVGAYGEDSNATGVGGSGTDPSNTYDSGAVYLFTSSSSWNQQAYIKASNTGQGDNFGIGVALSANGTVLAVGAYGERSVATGVNDPNQADDSKSGSGAVYLFGNSGSGWAQTDYIKASNTSVTAYFGYSVHLSADGTTLAVGSWGESSAATGIEGDQTDTAASGSGAAYLFNNSGGSWGQTAYIKATNTDANDAFGENIALSPDGHTLAIGAMGESSNATGIDNGDQTNNSFSVAGAVYLY